MSWWQGLLLTIAPGLLWAAFWYWAGWCAHADKIKRAQRGAEGAPITEKEQVDG